MNWFEQVQRYLAQATALVFGYDPKSKSANDFIRIAYHSDTTMTQANNQKDVCYVALSAAPETGKPCYHTYHENGKAVVAQVVPLSCLVSFYGTNADVNANKWRAGIMFDGGQGTPRFFLRTHNIVPVSKPDPSVSVPDIQDGYWRRRADVRVRLNYYMVEQFGQRQITDTDVSIDVITN